MDLVGKSDRDFYPEKFFSATLEDERRIMSTGKPIIGRVEKLENEDVTVTWFSASKYPLYDDNGNIVGTWGTSRNITGLKETERELERANKQLAEANAKLKELAIIDDLSGLYNRRNFHDVLCKTMRAYMRRRNAGIEAIFCLAIIDIDLFKNVNDTYGHVVGDAVIRYIADLLTGSIRPSDYAFRYGGDEFALMFQDITLQESKEYCERICRIVENSPYRKDGLEIPLTISIGVSCFDPEQTTREIIRIADQQLYASKNDGRNQVN